MVPSHDGSKFFELRGIDQVSKAGPIDELVWLPSIRLSTFIIAIGFRSVS
jgi:hypothetical protein